ncbi:uncharacterized protein [Sinocyclocheilus grahami]|uniref:uncharacterized protein isoform X2 n=1 Tax=Sinocyclocheilus grahami TaxID=75366 RepID=UPI0007AC5DB4|nr:PREDICTED: uncharacterized protein LOC107557165 isoform X2 [Sinocyclocheilus grahami]
MCSLQLAIPLEQASASNGPSQLPLGLHIPAAPLHLPPAPALQKLAPAPLNLPPAPAPQKLAPAPLNLSVAGPSPACAPKWAPFSTPQQMHKDTKPWMHNATLLLISLTKQMAEGFQSPVLKKVEMWKKVDAQMLAKGYDFGAEACDNKFRQLKHRYKTIVDSKKKTGSGTSSWVFFSSMEDLLADDPSVEPVLIVSSFAGDNLFHDLHQIQLAQDHQLHNHQLHNHHLHNHHLHNLSHQQNMAKREGACLKHPSGLISMSLSRGGRCQNSWPCKSKQ